LGVLKILFRRHVLFVQISLPIEILLALFEVRLGVFNLAGSNINLSFEIGRIDLEERIAFLHLLVVPDRDVDDRT
jgi:hypothetical protein